MARYRPAAPRSCASGFVAFCPEDLGIVSDFQVDGAYETAALGLELEAVQGHPGQLWQQAARCRLAKPGGGGTPLLNVCRQRAASGEPLCARDAHRQAVVDNRCLSGVGCGLGSTWIDPRFEPGPRGLYYGGDAVWAHGGHAGGPTFGSFTPAAFQPSGAWNRYVHGFGDGSYVAPTAPQGFVRS